LEPRVADGVRRSGTGDLRPPLAAGERQGASPRFLSVSDPGNRRLAPCRSRAFALGVPGELLA
jgi:hypothetical protein